MMISQLATVAIRARCPGLAGDRAAEVRDPLEEQVGVVRPGESLSFSSCVLATSGSRSVRRIKLVATAVGRGRSPPVAAPTDLEARCSGLAILPASRTLANSAATTCAGVCVLLNAVVLNVSSYSRPPGESVVAAPACGFASAGRRRGGGDRLAFARRSSRREPASGRTPPGSPS